MERGNYLEWRYENFSCWNREIHGNCLKYGPDHLHLYPRGLSGDEERLVVIVYHSWKSYPVKLSYIGSDGSLIRKQEIQNPRWETVRGCGYRVTLPPGPKFEDIVRTRKNKELQKDILTLRLYGSDYNTNKRQGCSTIDITEKCLRMSTFTFKDVELGKSIWISDISLNNRDRIKELSLQACLVGSTLGDAEIDFTFIPKFSDKVVIHTEISLLDSNGIVIKSEENKHMFRDEVKWDFFSISNASEIITNGFYVMMSVKYITGTTQHMFLPPSVEYIESTSTELNIPSKNTDNSTENIPSNSQVMVLSKELMCLYQDQDFSDIQLKCDNVAFPVHKNILSARSPVFKTMLSTDTKKAASSKVIIDNLDPSTLSHFLTFLYTGTIEDLQCDSALKLYYAADKYQVHTLKRECIDFLSAKVSISNVCDILSFTDKHQDEQLVAVSHDFILKNYKAVLRSKEWKSFMVKEPLLGVKTLTEFAERNRLGDINISQ